MVRPLSTSSRPAFGRAHVPRMGWPRMGWPRMSALLALIAVATVALADGPAYAEDVIVTRHPESCEQITIKCFEVLPETWTEVRYKEREKGAEKSVPLPLVVDIKRGSGGAERNNLDAAVQELEKGNLTEARMALRELAAGGFKTEDGQQKFTPFPKGGTGARGKRPAWTQEYAHFYYGKALVLEGLKAGSDKLLEEALLVLSDMPIPGQTETTGGFLGRFKGGNSRWLPDAMALRAQALLGLKRFDEATAAYSELFDQAVGVRLAPRWVYEAKVGAGRVAEAQGKPEAAIQLYEQAPTALETLLGQAPNRCLRLEIGRYYSRVRMRAAELLLRKAEAAGTPAAYVSVKTYLEESLPEALKKRLSGRTPEQLEALLAGARDTEVQAVLLSGLGQAYLADKHYDEAALALAGVAVRNADARERAAAALYHLAKAAEGAAATAEGEAKKAYDEIKAGALKRLKSDYPESPYATK